MEIEVSSGELYSVLDLCHLTSLTAPLFFSSVASYALYSPEMGMMVANSGACVSYLKAPFSSDRCFAIPVKTAKNLVSLSLSDRVGIIPLEDRIVIKTDHSRVELLTIPPEQYPYPEPPPTSSGFKVNALRFSLALERCASIAQDAYEPRKVVYLFSLPQNGELRCLGTDTYRVILDSLETRCDDNVYQTIPVSSVNLIAKACRWSANDATVTVLSDKEKLVLFFEKGIIVIHSSQAPPLNLGLVDKIEQAQAENNQYSVSGLAEHCAVVHAIARQNQNIARFKIEREQSGSLFMSVSSQTSEHFIKTFLPVDSESPEGEEWSLNIQFLRSILSSMQSDKLRLWIPPAGSSFPAWVIAPADAEFPVAILLPVVKR